MNETSRPRHRKRADGSHEYDVRRPSADFAPMIPPGMSPNIAARFYLAPGAILLSNRVTVNRPAVRNP